LNICMVMSRGGWWLGLVGLVAACGAQSGGRSIELTVDKQGLSAEVLAEISSLEVVLSGVQRGSSSFVHADNLLQRVTIFPSATAGELRVVVTARDASLVTLAVGESAPLLLDGATKMQMTVALVVATDKADSPAPTETDPVAPVGPSPTHNGCATDADCGCGLICAVGLCASADAGLGLAGTWRFEEANGTTAVDESGNGNDGVLTGAVTRTEGFAGGGLTFGATAGYVDVALAVEESFESATLSAWVKLPSVMAPANVLVAMGDNATSMMANNGARGFTLGAYTANWHVNSKGVNTWSAELNRPTPNAEWHHLVATFDATVGERALYLDGVEIGRDALYVTGPTPIRVIRLGGGAYGWIASGAVLDEVRVFRKALSASQIDVLQRGTRADCR